ncbi:MAG: hypothetical protein Kow0029_25170 [Candidatus Rifleibacteriota bacterium]
MAEVLSTLLETAERFSKTPEFIWNLSLKYSNILRPNLGEQGHIMYSPYQREIIGEIIACMNKGCTDSEIAAAISHHKEIGTKKDADVDNLCPRDCLQKKQIKLLSNQIKFLYKQICDLKRLVTAHDVNLYNIDRDEKTAA